MKINAYAFATIILLIMAAIALPYFMKSFVYNRVYKAVEKKDYDTALARLNEKIYTILFGKHDRDLMILRVHISKQDFKAAEAHIMEVLTSGNLSSSQSFQMASIAFYFFVDGGKGDVCKFLLPYMNRKRHQEEYEFASCLYRVFIEKKSEDIDANIAAIERIRNDKKLKEDPTQQIGLYQYLIGLQYMYKKQYAEAKIYLGKAKTNLKGTPYHKRINGLISNCK